LALHPNWTAVCQMPGRAATIALPVDAVLVFRFAVALIVLTVQMQAGGGEGGVAEVVADQTQIDVAVEELD
jgi:hypothetical protein